MAKKRRSTYQRYAQASRSLKAERNRQVKELRRLGLVSKKTLSKVQRRNALDRFRDVFTKRATVVRVPRGFSVKRLAKSFRVRGLNVVVPRQKGERIRVEKSGRITSIRHIQGKRVKRILHVGGKMPKPAKGKKFMYAVPFSNGQRVRFDDLQALTEFMTPYHSYKNWKDYLEIEEVDDDEAEGEG